jgi:hypothetical protein
MGSKRTQVVCVALGVVVAMACLVALSAQTWAQGTAAADEHRITLDLRDANIEDALRMIFRDTPYSFTIEPDVTGKVTLSLNEVPFARALRAILDINNPKLTYRKEAGDLYVITRQAEPATAPPDTTPTIEQPAAEQTVYWIGPGGRYQLQYLDCRDVAVWFGGTIIGGTPQYPFGMGGGGGGGGMGGGMGGGGLGGNSGGLGGGYGGGGGWRRLRRWRRRLWRGQVVAGWLRRRRRCGRWRRWRWRPRRWRRGMMAGREPRRHGGGGKAAAARRRRCGGGVAWRRQGRWRQGRWRWWRWRWRSRGGGGGFGG